jgi:hypothetical protein
VYYNETILNNKPYYKAVQCSANVQYAATALAVWLYMQYNLHSVNCAVTLHKRTQLCVVCTDFIGCGHKQQCCLIMVLNGEQPHTTCVQLLIVKCDRTALISLEYNKTYCKHRAVCCCVVKVSH